MGEFTIKLIMTTLARRSTYCSVFLLPRFVADSDSSCCGLVLRTSPGPRMAVDEGERANPSACGSPMLSERVLFKGQSVRVVVRVDMEGNRKASWWRFFLPKRVQNELTPRSIVPSSDRSFRAPANRWLAGLQ